MALTITTRPLTAAALALTLALPGAPALAQTNEFDVPADFSDMVEARLPAVVGVLSTGPAQPEGAMPSQAPQLPPGLEEFFGMPGPDAPPPGPMQSQGSGFIISEDGMVVTNNHVIAGAEQIEVILEDGRQMTAELVGSDPATDIALLKVETDTALPWVAWGASESLKIGDWVVAIGNPFGLGGTVTAGIVSARSRDINAGPYDDFLQTDAAINRGNSGGPLFDANGDVVGVNTAIFSPSGGSVGIGFAVPSRVAARIVADLEDDGMVERGWLGVRIQEVTEDIAQALGLEETSGVLVSEVTPGSPAAEAGLQPGDVITQLTGTAMDEPRELSFAVAELEVGSETSLTYWRDGERRETQVTIGQLPATLAAAPAEPGAGPDDTSTPRLGVSVAPLTDELRAQLQIPEEVSGLVLADVRPDGPAAEAGLRPNDVLTRAGGSAVTTAEELTDAAARAVEDGRPLLVQIWRNGGHSFHAIRVDQSGQ